jgi:hypothetical protein
MSRRSIRMLPLVFMLFFAAIITLPGEGRNSELLICVLVTTSMMGWALGQVWEKVDARMRNGFSNWNRN